MLDPEFMAHLVCPRCHSDLRDLESELQCTSPKCGLVFAVEDGIPNLHIEEARDPKSPRTEKPSGTSVSDV